MESKISVCFLLPYRADRFENGWLFFIFLRSLAYAIYRFIFPTPDGTNGAQNFRSYTSGSWNGCSSQIHVYHRGVRLPIRIEAGVAAYREIMEQVMSATQCPPCVKNGL